MSLMNFPFCCTATSNLLLQQDEKAKTIQTLLFVSGFNTLLQSFFGTRLPNVVVGSYAYLVPATSILLSKRFDKFEDPQEVRFQIWQILLPFLIVLSPLGSVHFNTALCLDFQRFEQTMRAIQGSLIATSLFQIVLGFLGFWRNFVR